MKKIFEISGKEVELELLSDDGNGNRLWTDGTKVANESYDTETEESFGLDDDIEGWNYDPEMSLV